MARRMESERDAGRWSPEPARAVALRTGDIGSTTLIPAALILAAPVSPASLPMGLRLSTQRLFNALVLMTAAAILFAAAMFTPARAADLPAGGRIGKIFSEPTRVYVEAPAVHERSVGWTWLNNSPLTPGYYGRPGDYYYSSYYGTSPVTIWSRAPYACPLSEAC